MTDDTSVGDAIMYVFEEEQLPRIERELLNSGGMRTDNKCPECSGTLCDIDNMLVCGNCSAVVDGSQGQSKKTKWDRFRENRDTYYNSNVVRCLGGFPSVYEWVESDDIDGTVDEVEPLSFYK